MFDFFWKIFVLAFEDFFTVYQLDVITRTALNYLIRIDVIRIVRRERKHLGHINFIHMP